MPRLVMWNLQTLDGCFEGAQSWDLDFPNAAWGDELARFSLDQAEEVGTLLFGRTTYEGMAGYWSTATGAIADFMNRVPKVVFSARWRRPAGADLHRAGRAAERPASVQAGRHAPEPHAAGGATIGYRRDHPALRA